MCDPGPGISFFSLLTSCLLESSNLEPLLVHALLSSAMEEYPRLLESGCPPGNREDRDRNMLLAYFCFLLVLTIYVATS